MATKKSSKKTALNIAKKSAKKASKKAAKKATKKAAKKTASSSSSTRSLEALQSSAFDRRDDDTSLYSSSNRDEVSSYTSYTQGEEEQGSRFRIVSIIVIAVILFLGFWLYKGQCSSDQGSTQSKIENSQSKPVDQVKPEEKKPVASEKSEEKVEPTKVEKPAGEPTTYTVVTGDVLGKIANKTGVSAAEIQKANPGVDLSKLKIGQVVKIPAK
ncbi:MAG: LysM peptidoglycan-binding domain-containing protein [Leptonema sp. (in: Bacteria)]|nr:LysM peptidoglycan-binding domain-containing protein [Leptonema sp. (in: bacteria)]